MTDTQYAAIAAQYDDESAAEADFDQLVAHLAESTHKHEFFDAALIRRATDGTLTVVKRSQSDAHRGTRRGLKIGIATGIAAALFPAVALGAAVAVAGGSGAGLGAIAGHISRKSPSKDLEAIGETLSAGSAGIVLVVEPDDADEVESSLQQSSKLTRRELAVDRDKLEQEEEGAYE